MTRAVLVTGGAGYVGSHTAALLLARGIRVDVLDDLRTGHRAAVPEGAGFHRVDLADGAAVDAVVAAGGYQAVLHFAANSLVGESMTDPFRYLGDNVANAVNLLRAMVRHGVKRFVLSSTANLFDDPPALPIDEDSPVRPGSPYGESKYLIERILDWADAIHGVRFAALRYFNAAGADPDGLRGEDHRPETHLIPIVLQAALGQRPAVEIFGADYPTADGTCVRDFIHVVDLAEAHALALDALDRGSRRYNLGTGHGYSVREVIETARAVTGIDIPVKAGPRRPGDPPALVADSRRIAAELGWRPRFAGLEPILETAWAWHKSHPDGYGD